MWLQALSTKFHVGITLIICTYLSLIFGIPMSFSHGLLVWGSAGMLIITYENIISDSAYRIQWQFLLNQYKETDRLGRIMMMRWLSMRRWNNVSYLLIPNSIKERVELLSCGQIRGMRIMLSTVIIKVWWFECPIWISYTSFELCTA